MTKGIRTIWIDSDTVGVTGTKVYRDGLLIDTVAQGIQEYKDPNVVPDVEYEYVLQAVTADGESVGEVLGVNKAFYTIVENPPLELTPIMSGFRVNQANPNRVYFDTLIGPVTGLTTQGFTISGKTISGVDTTLNYFTVTEAFEFWDQAATIRLENGNGVVYDFTMESIYNEMDEPTATTIRYMSADASGSGDGTSEGNAWTASQAESATAGMTVWMKAGDYGAVTSWGPNNSGAADNPIKFIGYKDTIGDITENYLDSYDSGGKGISTDWDINAFPTFKGSSTIGASTATAISFSSSYIIIRNLQTENYKTTMTGGPDHFVMDNFNSRNNYHGTEVSYHGFFLQNNTTLNNMRFRNLVLLNHSQNTFAIQGTTADFNLYENIRSWNDRTIKPERVDYHLTFNGNNNVLRRCYVENFNDDNNGSSHGIGMKTTGTAHANNYNLIELSTAVNQAECFYLRNYYCDYNVIKDCIADNNGSTSFNDCGGLWFWGGVHYNIYERCTVKNMNFCAIGLTDNDESPSHNEVGTDNTVRNCIFSNCKYGLYGKGEADLASVFMDNYFYNNIFHNITEQFYKIGDDSGVYKPVDISNLQMTNNVIDGCSSQGDALTGFVWDSNNFWQSWSNGLGTNSMNIEPQWIDTDDFVPQNESMIAGRVADLHYDINKTERAETDSTLGAVLLESETGGGTPPVTDIDYYVSNTGNDNDDGLTEQTAWATLAKVKAEVTTPGDVVAFERGGTWDEYFYTTINGSSGSPITFTAYGNGDKPVFNVNKVHSPTWSDQGGNVWLATLPNEELRRIKENGTEVLGTAIQSELGTNIPDLVKFYYDNANTNLYYYNVGEPSGIEYGQDWNGKYTFALTSCSYITFDNLDFRGGYRTSLRLVSCSNITVQNCNIGDMSNQGLVIEGSGVTNFTWINNTFDSKFTLDYSGTVQGDGKDNEQRGGQDALQIQVLDTAIISGNIFKNWSHSSISLNANIGSGDLIHDIDITGNTLTSPDIAYGGRVGWSGDVYGVSMHGNIIEDTSVRSQIGGHDNHVYNNIIIGTKSSPLKAYNTGEGMSMSGYNKDVYNNIIENNLFIDCEGAGVSLGGNNTSGDVTANIVRNNIMLNCGLTDNNYGISFETDYSTFSNHGNSFLNNSIYSELTADTIGYYGTAITVATFNAQTVEQTISNNIDGDPLVQPDYTITDLSPCVNNGVASLSNEDYFGNTRPYLTTNVDIGVNETTVEQTSGLGPELVTNGGFDSNADWSEENGTTIEEGVCKFNTAATWSFLTRQTLTMTEGVTYRVQFDLSDYSNGNVGVALGSLGDDSQESINTEGHHSYDLVYQVGATNRIIFASGALGSIMNIDNVSVKEVL